MAIDVLVAVRREHAKRFHENLAKYKNFNTQIVTDKEAASEIIADRTRHVDVFVIDNNLDGVYQYVRSLRQTYPRLLIVLVDEEADFGMPGMADEMTTEPFKNDDLMKRIERMMSDRQMETLRSDSLPAVRSINRHMKKAIGALGKQEAAVQSCLEMGFDYVAYYHTESRDPIKLELRAQAGPKVIQSIAPKNSDDNDLMGWVAQNGQSRLAGPEDTPNHPLVARGRLGAVACVPVKFSDKHFGVICACNDRPGSISQENIMMLELVATQLATALIKEGK
ncbi:MAG: hypothetical protein Kow00117_17130 [Phototrophicales bacterium]|nr:MAG: hypothetical protein CUN56_02710 [Phototrophicales bacterium]RMG72040.1 MAG: GAF domain-containing protein [Chloroflexota bacterium]